jgi:hypothetical protein
MKSHKRSKIVMALLMATLSSVLFVSGCAKKEPGPSPVPPAGTRVATKAGKSDVFKRLATDLRNECAQMGGCTCFLDGLQTTCGVVFACLDAGFCELAREG